MLQPSTLTFLKNLNKNNNKTWFDANRKNYEQAKEDFLLMVEKLIVQFANFDTSISNLKAKDCMFRINRDVRFSKDKSPYKSNMAAYFNKAGKKSNGGGYYIHIEPSKTMVGGGVWMPEAKDLNNIRQEIDYNFDGFKKIINNATFKKTFTNGIEGESLSRPPKGYEETNPAINFLKQKSFIVSKTFSDADVQSTSFVKDVTAVFKTMKPLIDFINTAVK